MPPGFPGGITLERERFQNWSRGIVVDDLWTCRPTTTAQLVRIVNWAARVGWRVRARGYSHNWSPLIVDPLKLDRKVVLIDMTVGFTGAEMVDDLSVRVKAGTSMAAAASLHASYAYVSKLSSFSPGAGISMKSFMHRCSPLSSERW